MADRGYIGIPEDGIVTAHHIHLAEAPAILIPTLRAIWAGLENDSHRMAAALLAEERCRPRRPRPTAAAGRCWVIRR